MTNPELDRPLSPQERLLAAKAAFRGVLLQDDTFFSVLLTRLPEQEGVDDSLPDFGLEPTIRRHGDGTSTIGVRINRGASTSGGEIAVHVGVYDYLPLGVMDTTKGTTRETPELAAALSAIGKENTDALDVWRVWQDGVKQMGAGLTSDTLVLDPMSDTFELETDVMDRSFADESD